jgi:GMP synthase-like glutamine amidotransferase
MNICVLMCGRADPDMDPTLPIYSELMSGMFYRADTEGRIRLVEMPVVDGEFPSDVMVFDGYLITGSSSSVYDPEEWIARLLDLIGEIYAARLPLVGICFGHQAIAQALGGNVTCSDKGWGVGIRRSELLAAEPWMDANPKNCDLIYFHRDQVMSLPDGAKLLMGDAFCPYAAFSMGDKLFALQGHPEFTRPFALGLLKLRYDMIGREIVEPARKSLQGHHDSDRVGKWIVDFFLKINEK